MLYPKAAGIQTRDLGARGQSDSDVGTVGVRFFDLNWKFGTREGKTALANELAVIVRAGLDLAAAVAVGATA